MHVAFFPFIPKPEDCALPVFCDKEVFKILVVIYLQRKDELQILIQMLDRFHTAKCVEHRNDKYIKGSGIEGSL